MYANTGAVPELIYEGNHHLESLLKTTLLMNLKFQVNLVLYIGSTELRLIISVF